MERERLAPLVVALLAVLALAVGAATLDSATSGSIAGQGEGPGVAEEESEEFDFGGRPPADDSQAPTLIPAWLGQLLVVFVVVAGLVGILYWIKREGLDAIKMGALAVFVLTGMLVGLFYLVGALSRRRQNGSRGLLGEGRFQLPSGGGGSGTGEVAQVTTDPSALLVAVFGIVLIGAVAVVLTRSSGDSAEESPEVPPETDPDPSIQAVGAAAGRAADRIDESGNVENAVFRAWREMTDPLDLPRETTTPGEFAAAAVDAGMSREDVTELTWLFETTRYGGRAVDESREERATAALRRIERTYGGDE